MRQNNVMTRDELIAAQIATRAEGRCGSIGTTSGLPCTRWPSAGFTCCRTHGMLAPATLAKAERLLAAARMPAVDALLTILDQHDADTCERCGFPNGSVDEKRMIVTTAKLVLDRTGLGPRATLDINTKRHDDSEELIEAMTDDERETIAKLINQVNQMKQDVRRRINATVEVPLPTTRLLDSSSTEECVMAAKNLHQKAVALIEGEVLHSPGPEDTER